MQDYKAIVERIVAFDTGGDLRPACGGNRGGVEEYGKLIEGIADVAGVL